jgi:hypothetical protein
VAALAARTSSNRNWLDDANDVHIVLLYIVVCLFALKPTTLDFSDHVLYRNVMESIPKIFFLAFAKEGSCKKAKQLYVFY